jgi:hypothetical protein
VSTKNLKIRKHKAQEILHGKEKYYLLKIHNKIFPRDLLENEQRQEILDEI